MKGKLDELVQCMCVCISYSTHGMVVVRETEKSMTAANETPVSENVGRRKSGSSHTRRINSMPFSMEKRERNTSSLRERGNVSMDSRIRSVLFFVSERDTSLVF